MNREIKEISNLFIKSSKDKEELMKLIEVTGNKEMWPKAHAYFNEIRAKNNRTSNKENDLKTLYSYIEVCYKSIFNLTHPSAPFDSYVPFKIVPFAIKYCNCVGLEPAEIIKIIG